MTENDGTYSALMELQQDGQSSTGPRRHPAKEARQNPKDAPIEDLSTTPYVSQNYRFTEDELRWLRHQSFKLTEKLGARVSQNTILRIALAQFRNACDRNSRNNPLLDALFRLKK